LPEGLLSTSVPANMKTKSMTSRHSYPTTGIILLQQVGLEALLAQYARLDNVKHIVHFHQSSSGGHLSLIHGQE